MSEVDRWKPEEDESREQREGKRHRDRDRDRRERKRDRRDDSSSDEDRRRRRRSRSRSSSDEERSRRRDRDRRDRDRRRDDSEERHARRRDDRHEDSGRRGTHEEREVSRPPQVDPELEQLREELRIAEQRLYQLQQEVEQLEAAEAFHLRGGGGGGSDGASWAAPPPPPPPGPAGGGAARPVSPGGLLGTFSLLLILPGDIGGDAMRRVAKLREKVLAPCDFNVKLPAKPKEIRKRFAEAARTQSQDDTTRAKGGDLGEVCGGDLPAELEEAARALAVNGVSQPIETERGAHLLLRTA